MLQKIDATVARVRKDMNTTLNMTDNPISVDYIIIIIINLIYIISSIINYIYVVT